mmetsp:Transcript_30343/g.46632  ORF Transcript_30343/g.46632 Transcript_30343/m.46632 type:complete len:229 (+) Transcript_30343:153-839(+)
MKNTPAAMMSRPPMAPPTAPAISAVLEEEESSSSPPFLSESAFFSNSESSVTTASTAGTPLMPGLLLRAAMLTLGLASLKTTMTLDSTVASVKAARRPRAARRRLHTWPLRSRLTTTAWTVCASEAAVENKSVNVFVWAAASSLTLMHASSSVSWLTTVKVATWSAGTPKALAMMSLREMGAARLMPEDAEAGSASSPPVCSSMRRLPAMLRRVVVSQFSSSETSAKR